MTKQMQPNIRFKGFKGNWNYQNLGQLLKYEQPQKYIVETTDYNNNHEIPVLTAGQNFVLGYTNETNGIYYANSNYPVIIFDDFTTSSHYVNFSFKVKSSAMKFLTLQKENDNFYFIYNILKNINYVPQTHERHWISKFSKFKAPIPDLKEQTQIGNLFQQLDKTISLKEQKYHQTQNIKKAMLEKMFPKVGSQQPEVRFKGFSGGWKQHKLNDIFSILDGDRGNNYPGESDFFEFGATLFLDTGNVKKNGFEFKTKKYITKEKDESLRNGKLELHDFVVTSRGTLGNVAYYNEKISKNHPSLRINSAMLILRPISQDQVSNNYLLSVLRGNIIDEFMTKNHVGSAQPHITKRDFSKLEIGIPKLIEEQQKIGHYFKQLDDTLTLQAEQLKTLKNIKQDYLNGMFVSNEIKP